MRSKIPADAMEYFRRQGAKGGKLSAKARMEKMTPEQRSAVARKAVQARWAKVKDDADRPAVVRAAKAKKKPAKPK